MNMVGAVLQVISGNCGCEVGRIGKYTGFE
jgi:hypothetical protein